MNIVRRLGLVAAFAMAGPLYAQGCSGGNDGGTDATGNQCNDPVAVDSSTVVLNGPLPLSTNGTGRSARARPVSAVVAPKQRRSVTAAMAPEAGRGSAKPANVDPSPCSGGSHGGMDMTGNQCGEYPVAAQHALAINAPKR